MAMSGDQDERDEKQALDEKDEAEGTADEASSVEAEGTPALKSAPPARRPGKGARGPGANRKSPPAKRGSLAKSLVLFAVIIGGVVLALAVLTREDQGGAPGARPKWSVGQTVEVELTVVKTDRAELSCASDTEVLGKHCSFNGAQKSWPTGSGDDKATLKPYTTTDRTQFVGAGLWSDLGATPLPAQRFSVKCQYKVEGNLKKADIRWDSSSQWYSVADWYAGTLSGCKIAP